MNEKKTWIEQNNSGEWVIVEWTRNNRATAISGTYPTRDAALDAATNSKSE